MSEDFYPFVDSGDAPPDNSHLAEPSHELDAARPARDDSEGNGETVYTTRIAIYDDMLSAPRVIVVERGDIRSYLEEVTNTVYRCMKEQGGRLALQVVRELVENLIHAQFIEPIISVLDGGNTIRFADQGPGIGDKERAFEFGVTSASREQKRYIRGTGSGFPIVSDYLQNAGGAISIEDNIGHGTVVTVSVDPNRVSEINQSVSRGAAVRGGSPHIAAAAVSPAQVPCMGDVAGLEAGMVNAPQGNSQGMGTAGGNGMPNATGMPTYASYTPAAGSTYPGYLQQGAYPISAVPGGYPSVPMQQQQVAAGYQPYGAQFSTIPQPAGQSGVFYPQQPVSNGMSPTMPTPMPAPAPQQPYVSERGMLALQYLVEHGSCGPTDLAAAFGDSTPTWSRELASLSTTGLVVKQGQKRILTDMGRAWMQQQQQQR